MSCKDGTGCVKSAGREAEGGGRRAEGLACGEQEPPPNPVTWADVADSFVRYTFEEIAERRLAFAAELDRVNKVKQQLVDQVTAFAPAAISALLTRVSDPMPEQRPASDHALSNAVRKFVLSLHPIERDWLIGGMVRALGDRAAPFAAVLMILGPELAACDFTRPPYDGASPPAPPPAPTEPERPATGREVALCKVLDALPSLEKRRLTHVVACSTVDHPAFGALLNFWDHLDPGEYICAPGEFRGSNLTAIESEWSKLGEVVRSDVRAILMGHGHRAAANALDHLFTGATAEGGAS